MHSPHSTLQNVEENVLPFWVLVKFVFLPILVLEHAISHGHSHASPFPVQIGGCFPVSLTAACSWVMNSV